MRTFLLALMIGFYSVLGVAAAPPVEVTLEPKQIDVGGSAQLTITSSGTGLEQLNLPNVAGLEFRIVGQSHRIEMIHGATLATTAVIVRVTARAPGIFTIPGLTPKAQPLVLRVNPENGSTPPTYGGNSSGHPPLSGEGPPSGIHFTADGSAYVKINLPKRDVYVGESIPVDIEVGMRSGFVTSLNGLPTLSGGDFTLNNLSRQPDRAERLIDGKPFVILTWHSVLAPIKPGSFTLTVTSPLTVRIRTQAPKESMLDDMLGDPFLQNFFGATVPKDITVSSPPTELNVLALPTEGRPASFSGAVGNFKIASELSASNAAVGDPLTLRLHVTGSGNFDRVDTSMLDHLDQWKTYPPKSTFIASDSVGHRGEKVFEQPLIASQPGPHTLPGLTFDYFDPSTKRYEVAKSAPINVAITPALADAGRSSVTAGTPGTPQNDNAARAPAKAGQTPSGNGLRPDHPAATSFASSLTPPYLRPAYLIASSLLTLALAGTLLIKRRRNSATARARLRERLWSKHAARLVAEMQAAALARNPVAFLLAAHSALQHTLSERWQLPVEAVTAAEVTARLPDSDLSQLFILADEVNYAGFMPTIDYDHWTRVVRSTLDAPA